VDAQVNVAEFEEPEEHTGNQDLWSDDDF